MRLTGCVTWASSALFDCSASSGYCVWQRSRQVEWMCRVGGVFDMFWYVLICINITNDIWLPWLLYDWYMDILIYSKRLDSWCGECFDLRHGLLCWHSCYTSCRLSWDPRWHLMAPVIFVYISHICSTGYWVTEHHESPTRKENPGVSLTVAFWCWTLPRAC